MKNIKNYYKDYNVVEIKEGLVALNLKFIEDKFFDKFTRSEKPQITAEEADIERACEWLDAKKAAEEAAYEKRLDEAVEEGKGYISFQPDEVERPTIISLDDFLKGDYNDHPELRGKVVCQYEVWIGDQGFGSTNLPKELFENSKFYGSKLNTSGDWWHYTDRERDRELDW